MNDGSSIKQEEKARLQGMRLSGTPQQRFDLIYSRGSRTLVSIRIARGASHTVDSWAPPQEFLIQ